MADLSTSYLGLQLKNPVILAACGLGASAEGVKKAAEAGAGAVVLKSLFEEQLRAEAETVAAASLEGAHPEADNFLWQMGGAGGAGDYLDLIEKAKAAARLPIIASVNCVGMSLWADFAQQIEKAGADALELNIGLIPHSPAEAGKALEDRVVAIVKDVAGKTKLPVAVKLGQGYSNVANVADRLSAAGAKAVVLFNRFYRLDIDLSSMSLRSGPSRSGDDEYHETLRWIAMLYGAVPCQLAAGTGVHSGDTVIKLVAAGAAATQVCSAVYKSGYGAIGRIVKETSDRMDALGLASVKELQGRLSRRNAAGGESYERLQYVKALTGIS